MSFQVDFFGVDFLVAEMNVLQNAFVNKKKMLNAGVEVFYSVMEETFNTEGRHNKWSPLSKEYAKKKARTHGNLPILQRTKELKDVMTGKDKSGMILTDEGESSMVLLLSEKISGRFYAHQFGLSVYGTGTLPVRQIVDLTQEDEDRIVSAMLRATPLSRFFNFLSR